MAAVKQEEGNVTVVVRVRPESHREQDGNHHTVVQVVDEQVLVFDPKEDTSEGVFAEVKFRGRAAPSRKNKDLKFVFDRVFDQSATQEDLFEFATKNILEGVLNGYNCSVFAYGATGAGKTHTMLGTAEQPGVMYFTMVELYKRIEQLKDEKSCEVAVSYLEVYNEQIQDLLEPKGPLALREDPQKGAVIQRLSYHQPKSAAELLEMLASGNRNRTQHPTDANATSSRSHAVFQVHVKQQDRIAGLSKNLRMAKMCLIDLAGSERASATKTCGSRFREGANINRSLLALGNVINALADLKKKKAHIPYRDSKLTRLLKDSLGGNCQTVMIAAISPSAMSYEDTYNTLKYANRAKDIKSSLKSNVVSLDCHISKYAAICEELKREITQLKDKLKVYEGGKTATGESDQGPARKVISSQQQVQQQRLEKVLQEFFTSHQEICKDRMDLESRLKEMELKTCFQLRDQKRIKLLCTEQKVEQASCKFERSQASSKMRHTHLLERKQQAEERFKANENQRSQMENEINLAGNSTSEPEILKLRLRNHESAVEVRNFKQQISHMTNLMMLQERDSRQTERLVTSLLQVVRKQFHALKGANLATTETVSEFNDLERQVRGEKAVLWADQVTEEEPEEQNNQPKILALATISKLFEKSFDVNAPSAEVPNGKPTESVKLEVPLRKRLPAKRCLTELKPSPSHPLRMPLTSLKRRRENEMASENLFTPEMQSKRTRKAAFRPGAIAPKVYALAGTPKDKKPFSNRSNTLSGEVAKSMTPIQQAVQRQYSETVTKARPPLATTTPSSYNFPSDPPVTVPSSNQDLNATFDLTDKCEKANLDTTITIGSVAPQGMRVAEPHTIFPKPDSIFLQRLGLPDFPINDQSASLYRSRQQVIANRPAVQRRRRSLSAGSLRVKSQPHLNRPRRVPVGRGRPIPAENYSPRPRSSRKISPASGELPTFSVAKDLPRSNVKNLKPLFNFRQKSGMMT
uniref:Kinesin-like protein n=1 Tax=Callorhinchus milii TaxID=7868 RepID=A0A4W3II76_CALMI|eukprot:gi/632982277/ref/XP_007908049.1/ PREDICTED: kinesin-like protein KIF18B isoform X1 [Callorhinchus milii]